MKDNNGLVVSIEAVKKPDNGNKAQELAAMEEALKKATEEAHKQRLALTGEESLSQNSDSIMQKSQALLDLKKKQENQQKELIEQLEKEEKARQNELKQNMDLESKITQAEKERQEEEILAKKRAEELKLLQEEEAAQRAEAEKREQEFLAA